MTARATSRLPNRLPLPAVALVAAAVLAAVPLAFAVDGGGSAARIVIPSIAGFSPVSETGPRWTSLTPAQREALAPLEEDWPQIDASRKQKWLEIAARYPTLAPAERQRLQQRMADWARMSPSQRGEVRLNYQQASRAAPAAERQAQWQAYQALPAEEKSRLAHRAVENARPAVRPPAAAAVAEARAGANARPTSAPSGSKSNLVPNPLFTAAPRPAGPTLVRPATGATTTLVNRQPAPPVHQQPGLPKVVASPTMVDPNTLLPQRGPQAAAVVAPPPAAAAAPAPAPAAPAELPAASTPPAPAAASAPSGPPYTDTSIGER